MMAYLGRTVPHRFRRARLPLAAAVWLLTALAILLGPSGPAGAAVTFYTDPAAFAAAVQVQSTTTFEGLGEPVVPDGTAIGGVVYTFNASELSGRVTTAFCAVSPTHTLGVNRGAGPDLDFFFPGESVTLTFPAPIQAIGAYFSNDPAAGSTPGFLSISTSVGTAVNGDALPAVSCFPANSLRFVGISSDTPFSQATFSITNPSPGNVGFVVDDILVGALYPPPIVSTASPLQILQYQTLDVTIGGANFRPGATADFGQGTEVTSVTFVDAGTLKARVSGLASWVGGTADSLTAPVKVTNPGGQFAAGPDFTVVKDTDGDGIPDNFGDVADNCPSVPNADQRNTYLNPIPAAEGGDACDTPPQPATLGEGDGTTETSTTTPLSGEPVFHEVCVTFPGMGFPYYFAPPDHRTIHLTATVDSEPLDTRKIRNIHGQIGIVIPDGLELHDGTADITRCFVVDLSEQFAFPPDQPVMLRTEYHSQVQPEGNHGLTAPVLIAELDLGTTEITAQQGSVQTIGGTLTVDPKFWNIFWETNATTGTAVFTLSSLEDGTPLSQIDLTSLLFEGTLPPASAQLTGGALKLQVNKTDLLRALRKRIGHPFTDGEVERVQLTGRLTGGGRIFRTGADITLQNPREQIGGLQGSTLPPGPQNPLADKIQASTVDNNLKSQIVDRLVVARSLVESGLSGAACLPLQQAIGIITNQRGKKIPTKTANDWLADATRIRNTLLECA